MVRSTILSLVAVLCFGVLAGCNSMGSGHASAPPERAVVATTNGGTTVYIPTRDNMHAMALTGTGDGHHCASCEAAAAKYFSTGMLDAKCKDCGATLTAVTGTAPSIGHN